MGNLNNHRLKILFLASWYPNEDHPLTGVFIKRHAKAVSKYCDVCVLYVHKSQHRKELSFESKIEDGIKTIRGYIPESGAIRYYHSCLQGYELVKKEFGKPDILHVNVIRPMGIFALFLNLFTGVPYVLTEHSTQFGTHFPNMFYKSLCWLILYKAKRILPVSTFLKENIMKLYNKNNYTIIPNVIDTYKFIPAETTEKELTTKQILHVSLLNDEHKNVSGLIRAISTLLKTRTDFELHIVGDGPDRTKLEKLSLDLDLLDQHVFFHGRVGDPELVSLMQSSNFFVLNSKYETFSIVCAEALSTGVPVIATICGGPEEYITKEYGVLITPGNNMELVNAMNYMLDNYTYYNPEKLHKYIEDRFSYDAVGASFYTIYLTIRTPVKF